MNPLLLQNPELFCLRISGQIRTSETSTLIFQKSHNGQQKKIGPIIPANPKTQKQQLTRIRFAVARQLALTLDKETKEHYASLVTPEHSTRNWYHEFMSRATKNTRFNTRRFGEGSFHGALPQRHGFRFNNLLFGDGFYSQHGDIPTNLEEIAAAFPNINLENV